jgi:hypothetical protein
MKEMDSTSSTHGVDEKRIQNPSRRTWRRNQLRDLNVDGIKVKVKLFLCFNYAPRHESVLGK